MKKWQNVENRGGTTPMSEYPNKDLSTKNGMEHCIVCKKPLPIPFDRPIAEREWYLQGCGQMCRNCYDEVIKGDGEKPLTDDELWYIAHL